MGGNLSLFSFARIGCGAPSSPSRVSTSRITLRASGRSPIRRRAARWLEMTNLAFLRVRPRQATTWARCFSGPAETQGVEAGEPFVHDIDDGLVGQVPADQVG